jgi:hypothetical protein
VPACGDADTAPAASPDRPFVARACKIETDSQTFHVRFAGMPANAENGAVSIDVVKADGSVAQTLTEQNVSEYVDPTAVDFDGDGRDDIEIPLATGNANEDLALWRSNPRTHQFERIGEVSGTSIQRTSDGYLAVPNRGGAASWEVSFYRIDGAALTLLVSVAVEASGDNAGRVTGTTCTLAQHGPGLRTLGLSDPAARTKFCAELSARVFDQ